MTKKEHILWLIEESYNAKKTFHNFRDMGNYEYANIFFFYLLILKYEIELKAHENNNYFHW